MSSDFSVLILLDKIYTKRSILINYGQLEVTSGIGDINGDGIPDILISKDKQVKASDRDLSFVLRNLMLFLAISI